MDTHGLQSFFNLFAIVLFPLPLFVVVVFIISRISGWGRLAEDFKSSVTPSNIPSTDQFSWVSARLRFWMRYNSVLILKLTEEGIHLSVFFLVRIGHPPLFIPWRSVSNVYLHQLFLTQYAEVTISLSDHSVMTVKFANIRDQIGLRIERSFKAYQDTISEQEGAADHAFDDLKAGHEEQITYTLDQR